MTPPVTTLLLDRPRSYVPDLDDDLTRRGFLVGAGLLTLVPGCGSGAERREGAEAPADVRVIEHKYGSTEITGTPERVVALGVGDHDVVLALGSNLVGLLATGLEIPLRDRSVGSGRPR